jgi:hypothetical protein
MSFLLLQNQDKENKYVKKIIKLINEKCQIQQGCDPLRSGYC